MHVYIQNAYNDFVTHAWHFLYASAICLALELLLPANRYSLVSRVRGATFRLAYLVINAAFFAMFVILWGKVGITPLFNIDFSTLTNGPIGPRRLLVWIAVPILIGTVGDFFYYWFHRMQHTFKFLWRFHAVHHSVREMSAWNSNHHWTEEISRIPVVLIPLSLLFSFSQVGVPLIILAILDMQGQFEHSATRVNFGWFRRIVADNRFHRIHHSLDRQHFNKNFGSFSSIWDVIFRTAHFPKKGEWPDVGLSYVDEPKRLSEFLWRPFRRT